MTPPRPAPQRSSGPVTQRFKRSVREAPLVWLTALMTLLSVALVALVLSYMHAQAIDSGIRLTASLARVIEEQTNRTLQTIDQRLQLAAIELAQLDRAGGLDAASGRRLLRRQLEGLPFVRAMWLMDAQGRISLDSDEGNIGVKLADRAYFQHHLAQPQSPFFVGPPVRSRTTGTWLISASRPLQVADGRFTGIIVAALEPPYLDALWRTIDLGTEGSIALFRRDGVLMARSPVDEASIGKNFSDTPLFNQWLARRPAGSYQRISAIDGVLREFSYRSLSSQPDLVVVVGQSHDNMLAPWRRFAGLVLAVWLLAVLALAALGAAVVRASRDRQRSEDALRRREQDLAIALHSIGDAVIATDVAGRVTRMNPVAERLTGWPLADALGRPLDEVFHIISAQTRLPAANPVQRVLATGEVIGLANHTALLARDGQEYQIADSAAPTRDAAGAIQGVVQVFSDLSEKYLAEAELQATRNHLQATLDANPDLLFEVGLDGRLHSHHTHRADLLAAAPEVFLGKTIAEVLPDAATEVCMAALREAADKGWSTGGIYSLQLPSGECWFELSVAAMPATGDGDRRFILLTRDITARRRVEMANAESEMQLRLVIRGGDIGFWDWDLRSGALVVNERWCDMLGLDSEGLTPGIDAWNSRVHPDDAPKLVRLFEQVIQDPAGHGGEVEVRARHEAGHWVWILDRFSIVSRAADGAPLRVVGTHMDITERKHASLALQASEARARAIINASPVPIALNDRAGNITFLNPAFTQTFGYALAEIPTLADWWPLAYPDPPYRQEVAASWAAELARSARTETPFTPIQLTIRCRDGTDRFALVGAAALADAFEGSHLVMLHDVTERHIAELALQSALAEKTALLKEVHHRVKNNLQVVSSLLRLEAGRSSHAKTQTVLAEMQGRIRAMALLHELVYRSGTFVAIDLGAYLRQVATQAMRSLQTAGGSAQIRLRLNLGSVQVGLDQATPCGLLLTELVSNALKHAFPDGAGGEVFIELQPVPGGAAGECCLRVSDNGVGLPADFAARQQESLGLQLVASLATQLGGRLVVGAGADDHAAAPVGASFAVNFAITPNSP
jgi:PAS domain S-box-containing protein